MIEFETLRKDKPLFAVLGFVVVVAVLAVLLVLLVIFQVAFPPPAGSYVKVEVLKPTLCQQEPLTYRVSYTVKEAGLQVFAYSVWSVDEGYAVVHDHQPEYTVFTVPTQVNMIDRVPSEGPMPFLPKGRYELRLSIAEWGDGVTVKSLPFNVEACEP